MRQGLPRVLLASANLEAGRGGIARVGRMSLKALEEAGYPVAALSFSGERKNDEFDAFIRASGSCKIRFLANHLSMLPCCDFALYDHVGLARGRQLLGPVRRPFAVWIHGNEVWEDLRPDHKQIIQKANAVLVNSRYTLDRYERLHGSLAQAHVCHLATEQDPMAMPIGCSPSERSDGPTVLVLGRLEAGQPGKGHAELIDCWGDVIARVPKAKLLIVGQGSGLNALQNLAQNSSAVDWIEFLGFVPDEAIEAVWRRTDIFAMPSRQEGFGIVYTEAMSRGKPILASVHDAGQEVNVDGLTGFNVALDERKHLIERLTRLLLDRQLRENMGRAGYRRWKAHFQYDCFKMRLLDILSTVHQSSVGAV